VARIDPSAREGTVLVDLTMTGPLPAGARPDLSVDGIIELERLPDVVYISRPVNAQEHASATVFKVVGNAAVRTKVELGRGSASTIEVTRGLAPGDQVIVSDTSSYERNERIQLN